MGDRNLEVSLKVALMPGDPLPERFRDPEEVTAGADGPEVSVSYNVLGHVIRDDFFFLGPRLDLSAMDKKATRYRSGVSLPVSTLEEFNEQVDHPEYQETERAEEIGLLAARAGASFGIGPDTSIGAPLGLRLFFTAGPERTSDYAVRTAGAEGVERDQDGETILGMKGGMELLLVWDLDHKDIGFVAGMSGIRTYNPIKREAEGAVGFDAGFIFRF